MEKLTTEQMDLGGLLLELQKDIREYRKENQEIQADLKILKKIFSYKVKKVTTEEFAEGKLNAWRMKMYAKC